MIGFDEAVALLAGSVLPLETERVDLVDAVGRVFAEPIHAAIAAPRRSVSAMDGYALCNCDVAVGARLRIIGESFAGGPPPPALSAGECVRIFTGAALPVGSDRVVMQENCISDKTEMTIVPEFGPGWHVRQAASDFAEGDLLLLAGTLLEAGAMITLAAADRASALVYKRPRVAIVATGDELVPPGTARDNPLKIPESVSFGVAALAQQYGASIQARLSGADDLATLRHLAGRALALADVLVVTGGASVGERDYAKAMFAEQDLEPLFTKVAIKPGKPIWIARSQGRWVVGLPGNPSSALVTARLFLAPLLGLLQGRSILALLDWIQLPVAASFPASGNRTTFARATLSPSGLVPLGNQDSGAQTPLSQSKWLVRSDPSRDQIMVDQKTLALAF